MCRAKLNKEYIELSIRVSAVFFIKKYIEMVFCPVYRTCYLINLIHKGGNRNVVNECIFEN